MLDKTKCEKPEPEIILITETPMQSLKRDATTYLLIVTVLGTGWLMGSAPMEWTGFVMLMLGALVRITLAGKHKMTIAEARKKLDELEKGQ